jgi:putative endonuclease
VSDREAFARAPHPHGRGRAGEEAAVAWLRRQGYEVVERNAATETGEIDLVARDGDTLCFVEIKARAGGEYGPAVEAVDRRKQRRLARAAALWLVENRWDGPCRFDVLGLDAEGDAWRFSLVRDAFAVEG